MSTSALDILTKPEGGSGRWRSSLVPVIPADAATLPAGRAFGFYCEPFLRHCEGRMMAEGTLRAYAVVLRTFGRYVAELGLVDPAAVRPRTIEAYLRGLALGLGLAASTVNQHKSALHTFFSFLRREQIITSDPVKDVLSHRQEVREPDILDLHEQARVLEDLWREAAAAWCWESWRTFAIVAVGLGAGLRCAEIAAIEVDHLRLDAGYLRVISGKGRKDRTVVLASWFRHRLADWLRVRPAVVPAGQPGPYLFMSRQHPDRPLGVKALYNLIHAALSPRVARPIHPHMLRHSYACRLLVAGVNLEFIRRSLGHAGINTTQRYLSRVDALMGQTMPAWLGEGLEVPAVPVTPLEVLAAPVTPRGGPPVSRRVPPPRLRVGGASVTAKADARPASIFLDLDVRAELRRRRATRRAGEGAS